VIDRAAILGEGRRLELVAALGFGVNSGSACRIPHAILTAKSIFNDKSVCRAGPRENQGSAASWENCRPVRGGEVLPGPADSAKGRQGRQGSQRHLLAAFGDPRVWE